MRKQITLLTGLILSLCSWAPVNADISLYEIDQDPAAWQAAIANCTPNPGGSWNLDDLPDFGLIDFDGPLGSGGSGPVPAGFFNDKILIDSEENGPGGGGRGVGGLGLVAVGPLEGFGNPSNAIIPNYFDDSLRIDLLDPKCAIELNVLNLLGDDTVDILATDERGNQFVFAGVSAPATGNRIGLAGRGIHSISIYDSTGNGGEGFQGTIRTWVVPEPSSAALLGFLGLGITWLVRRRD